MKKKLKLGVIFGGRSGEHEVSLMSARSIISSLDREKYEVIEIGITLEGHWYSGEAALERFEKGGTHGLQRVTLIGEPGQRGIFAWQSEGRLQLVRELEVVFPILHGTYGEDGTLQGLLELADMPYVGSGVLASSVGMDKGLFKQLMMANRIPVVDFGLLLSSQVMDQPQEALRLAERVSPYPLFTKPANLGSSVGISKCRNRADLLEGLMKAARYDRRVIVERGIDAREIEVSVLGNEQVEASVAGEIIPSDSFYSYRAKYIDEASEMLIPAPIAEELSEKVKGLAIEAFKAIDGAGLARVDFLLDRQSNRIYLNELNTMPGFTRISMYPKLWEASGLPYPELVDRLVELGIKRFRQKDRLVRRYEGGS